MSSAVPVISFVAARSGTGKTTLLEKVLAGLTAKGYRVVTLKHVHEVHLDPPGKDSWRHRRAGALATGLLTPEEFVLIREGIGDQDPRAVIPFLPTADLVLLEGFHRHHLPKIEVVRAEMGREIVTPLEDLAAIATDVPDLEVPVPCFPLADAALLVDWLCAHFLSSLTPSRNDLTHLDGNGRARMVDVSRKEPTEREAVARGEIHMRQRTLMTIKNGGMSKGDVLAVAQVAAIMAVKETPRLIPMCHPLDIAGVSVDFHLNEAENKVEIEVRVKLTGRTGVEMEALTGVSVAALTVYDMCKALDREMEIGRIRLVEKTGGRSGHFQREEC